MINSTAFNYVNLLGKAADASWTRETLLANNIANVDTPNYKRKDIDFQSVLEQQLGRCKPDNQAKPNADGGPRRADPQRVAPCV